MAESLPISGDKRVYNTRSRKRSLETDEKEELPKCVNLEKEEVTSKGNERIISLKYGLCSKGTSSV